jgi:hypothetical protein
MLGVLPKIEVLVLKRGTRKVNNCKRVKRNGDPEVPITGKGAIALVLRGIWWRLVMVAEKKFLDGFLMEAKKEVQER